ncbi:MAG: alpha/beta hydrolase [Treponema sp.]|nr:alpha/beta hydrolase [Candidatus Treponema equifaecale]
MKKLTKNLVAVSCTVLALGILFVLAVYAFVFKPSFERHDPTEKDNLSHFKSEAFLQKNIADTEWFFEQNPQELTMKSFDGLNLFAYVLPAENARGTFVLMHGYHSSPLREYSSLMRFYHGLGYNIVLPYQRTHGKSEGKYVTFGIKERYDLRDWILETNKIFGDQNPVYLQGISMGCATTVMCLGFDLPENVKGAVADCGFTSPREIIWKVLKKDMKMPFANVIMALGNVMTKFFADFSMDEYSTLLALRYNKIPVIFIHGAADDFVPVEMTFANYQYCTSEKYLHLVADCPHAIAYLIDEEGYHDKVVKFLGL